MNFTGSKIVIRSNGDDILNQFQKTQDLCDKLSVEVSKLRRMLGKSVEVELKSNVEIEKEKLY